MKVDAHCAFDKGFDVKMMNDMQDNYTMAPVMRNLHVFNWKCKDCGDETYQGPAPEGCKSCDVNTPDRFEKVIKWIAKTNPQSTAFRFNTNLQFKYFPELKKHQVPDGNLVETMSLQGSCFMLTREKYFELNICDESWGSWGQQGTEVALKTWLSGGRVVINLSTFYGHLFRTQPGFSFPWHNTGKAQQHARSTSQDIFLNNKWEKQIHPLSWLLEKFWPELLLVGDPENKWTEIDLEKLKKVPLVKEKVSKGVLYYSDNMIPMKIAYPVRKYIKRSGLPITSVTLKKTKLGHNIVLPGERGKLQMFKQIVAGLEAMTEDVVFFCEHDVLYSKSHFDFIPPSEDKFYYNENNWRIRMSDGYAVYFDHDSLSQLCVYRELALKEFRDIVKRYEEKEFRGGFEPGTKDSRSARWRSEYPNLDIRHDNNFTPSRWSPDEFRDKSTCTNWKESTIDAIPGWENIRGLLE
jgi:hypothetical protein